MKILDIALKDMTRSFRSAFAVIFMFGVPLLVTGMFYFMFGNIASNGEFDLPQTQVIIANLDEGGPKFQVSTKNIPGGARADTMGELVVSILQSEELADLIQISFAPSAASARAAVDAQAAQVAVVIPADFSKKFADPDSQAVIEFYQDPTLTIGPEIIHSILNRFMDGMAGVKIAVNVFLDEAAAEDYLLAGQVVQAYLDISLAEAQDLEAELLAVRAPNALPEASNDNLLLSIVSPIMGGMMIFYAFFTGTSTAQSILKEEEEGTLPRLFTTPTPQASILTGKFLATFLTVLVQVVVLLLAARLVFGIQWGQPLAVALAALGIVCCASTMGIFINSFLQSTKQGGVIFGGVLTITGMIGMISIFALNSPGAARLGDTVSLLVPQGWAVRGLMQAMEGLPATQVGLTALIMFAWSAVFFTVGVWRFNRRYR
jgi:ABC-2 type transport system permease protein